MDSSGNVYTSGSDGTVKKFSSNGTFVWSFEESTTRINCLAVDASGYVYCGTGRGSEESEGVYKISPNGAREWFFALDYVSNVEAIAVDKSGYVYAGSDLDNVYFKAAVYKISPSGSRTWRYINPATAGRGRVYAIAVDGNGYIYIGGDEANLKCISPTGSLVWSYSCVRGSGDYIYSVTIDQAGYIYCASGLSGVLFKIASNGNKVWEQGTGKFGAGNTIKIDSKGYIYISDDSEMSMHSSSGSLVWTSRSGASKVFDIDNNRRIYAPYYSAYSATVRVLEQNLYNLTLVKPNISSIPLSEEISEVSLSLAGTFDIGENVATITISKAAGDWDESTVTWTNKPAASDVLGSFNVSHIISDAASRNITQKFLEASDLVSWFKRAHQGQVVNNGIYIESSLPGYFYTKEINTGAKPKLIIKTRAAGIQVPVNGGFACVNGKIFSIQDFSIPIPVNDTDWYRIGGKVDAQGELVFSYIPSSVPPPAGHDIICGNAKFKTNGEIEGDTKRYTGRKEGPLGKGNNIASFGFTGDNDGPKDISISKNNIRFYHHFGTTEYDVHVDVSQLVAGRKLCYTKRRRIYRINNYKRG